MELPHTPWFILTSLIQCRTELEVQLVLAMEELNVNIDGSISPSVVGSTERLHVSSGKSFTPNFLAISEQLGAMMVPWIQLPELHLDSDLCVSRQVLKCLLDQTVCTEHAIPTEHLNWSTRVRLRLSVLDLPSVTVDVIKMPISLLRLPNLTSKLILVITNGASLRAGSHIDGEVSESPWLVLSVLVQCGCHLHYNVRLPVSELNLHILDLLLPTSVTCTTHLHTLIVSKHLTVSLSSINVHQELLLIPRIDLIESELNGDLIMRRKLSLIKSNSVLTKHTVTTNEGLITTFWYQILTILTNEWPFTSNLRCSNTIIHSNTINWLFRIDDCWCNNISVDIEISNTPRLLFSDSISSWGEFNC